MKKLVFLTGAGMSVESGFKISVEMMACGKTILWNR